jgi:hypothetical protein
MWDFDQTSLDEVIISLFAARERFGFGTFHVLESSPGNYMAICFEKYPARLARRIIAGTSGADPRHAACWKYRASATLRFTEKGGTRVQVVWSDACPTSRLQSTAHALFYQSAVHGKNLYHFNAFECGGRWDGLTRVTIDGYCARSMKAPQ